MTPDQIVLNQARKRLHDNIIKKGRPPQGWAVRGPGGIAKGSIYDCSRAYFERLLKNYFSELYIGWNPFKNEGRGCWEVWQRPFRKEIVYMGRINGEKLYLVQTATPNDMEHHVYDLPYLTPAFIDKLREMDTWENKRFFQEADDKQEDLEEKYEKMETESIKYAVRHHKSLFRKLKELAQEGYNPLWFFSDHRQGDGKV